MYAFIERIVLFGPNYFERKLLRRTARFRTQLRAGRLTHEMLAALLVEELEYRRWDAEQELDDEQRLNRIHWGLMPYRSGVLGQLTADDAAILERIDRWRFDPSARAESASAVWADLERDFPNAMSKLKSAITRSTWGEGSYSLFGSKVAKSEKGRAEAAANDLERQLGKTFIEKPDQRARLTREWLRNMTKRDAAFATALRERRVVTGPRTRATRTTPTGHDDRGPVDSRALDP